MKKFAVGFFLLLITLIIGVFSFNLFQKPTDVFISPSGKHKVELYGDTSAPWFFANIVTANIFSDEKMMGSEEIHYGDGFDVSFESAYKCIKWQNNEVLRFSETKPNASLDVDKLTIFNKTTKKVEYLLVRFSGDKYLIFNLDVGGAQTLSKRHSEATSDAHIVGKFEDGEKIEPGTTVQSIKKLFEEKPIRVCLSVENYKQDSTSHIVKPTDCSL
jgi:hypothetical protein